MFMVSLKADTEIQNTAEAVAKYTEHTETLVNAANGQYWRTLLS